MVTKLLKKTSYYPNLYHYYFSWQAKKEFFLNYGRKRFTKTVVIVTYHRIANVTNDPRLLCVSPEKFEQHIKFYTRHFQLISLPELVNRLQNKALMGNELVVTFDDGYVDNLDNALPILKKYNVPATIFVCTGQLGQEADFAWDKKYTPEDRAHFLSENQLKRLSDERLITIGAHTHRHPRLRDLSEPEQMTEIKDSKDRLETIIGQAVTVFAYPFGRLVDISPDSPKIAKKLGFISACTMQEALVTKWSNLYKLPRINIRNYSEPELRKKLFQ